MSRQRSICIISKQDFLLNIYQENDKEKIFVEDKFTEKKYVPRGSLVLKNPNQMSFNLKTPQFTNTTKEYKTKNSFPLLIHEKSQLIGGFDKKDMDIIDEHDQVINIGEFLYQFKNEEEIQNLEIQDILDIDYEKLEELKCKAKELIDATSMLIDEKEKIGESTERETELLVFFSQKLQEMLSNEINLQIFVNNIEKVKGISYSNTGVKIFFKGKK